MKKYHQQECFLFQSLINEKIFELELLENFTSKASVVKYRPSVLQAEQPLPWRLDAQFTQTSSDNLQTYSTDTDGIMTKREERGGGKPGSLNGAVMAE